MMPRRHFMEASAMSAMTVGVTTASAATAAAAPKSRSGSSQTPLIYELRAITLRIGAQPQLVHDYLSQGYLPALNRLGIKPIGVFELTFGPGIPTIYLLIPHASLASFGSVRERLSGDVAYAKNAAVNAFINAPAIAPAYGRSESTLLAAFDSIPTIETPKSEPRIFELRTYENPTDGAHLKKMEMFTPKMGELAIFRRVGLTPVFFGQTLVGPRLPSFTYMLTFADLAAREKAWTTFRADPEWLKLKATPGYSDAEIMSNVSDLILRPTAYSQI
jgi:hypothetical protein